MCVVYHVNDDERVTAITCCFTPTGSLPKLENLEIYLRDGSVVTGSYQGDSIWYWHGNTPYFVRHGYADLVKQWKQRHCHVQLE